MKKILHSRLAVGILCVALAFVITFGLSPYISKTMTERTRALFATTEIQQGDVLTEANTEMRTIGAYNIPVTVITKKDQAIGKYASYDILPGDYITSAKIQGDETEDFKSFNNLDGTRVAMSVSIKNFSDGLSGKLSKGDIISFLSVNAQSKEAEIIPELKYVYVMAITFSEGVDKDEAAAEGDTARTSNAPSTITVLVSDRQARLLGEAEESGRLWALLAYRGGRTNAQKFLDEQDAYNASAAAEEAADSGAEGAAGENSDPDGRDGAADPNGSSGAVAGRERE
ncbi:MAG: SAF domain-containing protein [Clostridiales Family XIII bacterium]|jgi:pilus assembly protein CpaB|nr:SAF domain-containing protein [Clostridiales Family XIII bacterium]